VLHIDDKQNASGSLKICTDHGNASYSVSVSDKAVRDGDVMNGLRLGMRTKDGGLEAHYYVGTGHHLLRVQNTVQVIREGDGSAFREMYTRESDAALCTAAPTHVPAPAPACLTHPVPAPTNNHAPGARQGRQGQDH
jgi:hypothetical protein